MRWLQVIALAALVGGSLLAAEEKVRTFVFARTGVGTLPPGWTAEKTGKGKGGAWEVVTVDGAPSKTRTALAQTGSSPGPVFNLCVAQDTNYKDLEISVALHAVSGRLDQGGGVVWRYQDANNYYLARLNPLEDNYRVYKVVAGKRTQLATKEDVKVRQGQWPTLQVRQVGDQIECYLDGTRQLEVRDATFTNSGKVGLWTKADAQTYFADLKVSGK